MRQRIPWATLLALLAAALLPPLGCDSDPATTPPSTTTGAGADQPYDGGTGGDGPDADADGSVDPDAGTSAVLLGLTPNPGGDGGGGASATDVLAAELATYAVGVRAVVVARRWDQLDADAIDELTAKVTSYRDRDLAVVLVLLVVDRYADGRPSNLQGLPWDHDSTRTAMEGTLDALLAAVGTDLQALVFGRQTERYLATHPSESEALEALLLHGTTYTRSVDAELPTGVGLSFVGDSPSSTYQALLDLGQQLLLSYFPGRGQLEVPADTSTTKDLDAMIALAGGKPIVLLATGYTSSPELDSSDDGQQQFYDALFSALQPRREHFAAVNVDQLHDLAPADCATYAASQGEEPDGAFARYVCASGLKRPDGTAKPAWQAFISGAAAFASP